MNKKLIAIPILLLIIGLVAWWWVRRAHAGDGELLVSGTVEATEAQLGFQMPGKIASISVREGDRVAAGQLLGTLEAAELNARRAQAEAQVAAAQAALTEMQRGSRPEEIRQAAAAAEGARERLEDARADLRRNRALYEGRAISAEALQKSSTAVEVARSQLDQAEQQLALVRQGPRAERIAAQRAQVEAAQAAAAATGAQLEDAQIVAPMAGVVTVRHNEPNEVVSPGQPVVTVMNPDDRWVRVFVPEDRVGRIQLGEAAVIRSDSFPDKSYRGRVSYISPEAEFTPKSVQTPEERVRLVYAVKVRIEGDPAMELKPGMPVDVDLGGVVDE